jgi:ArsR family transcriptional regulator, zinc-responsive transcriptional repressor
MGVTKTDLFTEEQNTLAQLGKVFSHPARVAILQHLIQANACINMDLIQELGLAQATISQHLKELKSIGIIKGTVDGVSVNYCIDETKWKEFKSTFELFFDQHPCCSGNSCC